MTGNVFSWSKTPSANDTADSAINWQEGMLPPAVNNSARGMMAAGANWRDDISGQITTAGTGTAYTLTTNSVLTALADGVMLSFKASITNTGPATLAVDGLTAKSLRAYGDIPLAAGDIVIGGHYLVQYDSALNSAAGGWFVIARSSSSRVLPPLTVYNGGFEVWQRTTSLALAASATTVAAIYAADRWSMETGANQACVVSRQTGLTATSRYCARVQRNSGQTGTGVLRYQQWFETDDAVALRGRTITLSVTLKAGTNYSAATSNLVVRLYTGTGAEGRRTIAGGAWTGEATPIDATQAITTTATRYTFTSAAIGAAITQATIAFEFTPVGTASTNDYFEIDDVRLDDGTAAFSYVPTAFQDELDRCARYYEKSYNYSVAPGTSSSPGAVTVTSGVGTANTVFLGVTYGVRKRSAGTPAPYNPVTGVAGQMRDGGGTASATTNFGTGETGFSCYNSGFSLAASSSATIQWVCEAEL
jgi:hypothetical protein